VYEQGKFNFSAVLSFNCFAVLLVITQAYLQCAAISDDGSGEYSNSDEISSNSSTSVTSGMSKRFVQAALFAAQRLPVTCQKGRSKLCLCVTSGISKVIPSSALSVAFQR
jgi:hypothetical protein